MHNLFIIHFSPPEVYPPLQNMLHLLEQQELNKKILVFTTAGKFSALKNFESNHPAIRIVRMGSSGPGIGKWARLFNYIYFYAGCISQLILKRPSTVLYYETLSSFPAYVYKRFINRHAAIMVHYHEYTSKVEYQNGMLLGRWFHGLEKWLYPRVEWLSHTNKNRMQLFLEDIDPIKTLHTKILPNYPPASWQQEPKQKMNTPVRFLYVGSLSLQTMFTRELAQWIIEQNGQAAWDIYSYNPTPDAMEYIHALNSPWVQLKEGVDYKHLRKVICKYDIGVILYTGHIPNYVYNAPNKLFEYLAAGLDVWYPKNMQGCFEYDSTHCHPKVLRLDFSALELYDLNTMVERKKNCDPAHQFSAEDVLMPFVKTFIQ